MNRKYALSFRLASAAFAATILCSGVGLQRPGVPGCSRCSRGQTRPCRSRSLCAATGSAAAAGHDRFDNQRSARRA